MEIIININSNENNNGEDDEYVMNEKWKFIKEEKEDKSKIEINIKNK